MGARPPIAGRPREPADEPMLEAYTALGYLAATTSRIRLGTMVTAATFRAPPCWSRPSPHLTCCRPAGRGWESVPATTATRLARWALPPETAERFARMTELLRLAWQCGTATKPRSAVSIWTSSTRSAARGPSRHPATGADRRHRRAAHAAAGRRVRRRVQSVRRAESGAAIRRQLAVLDRHCADVGRPPEEVERTVTTALKDGSNSAELTERCNATLASWGATRCGDRPRAPAGRRRPQLCCGRGGSAGRFGAYTGVNLHPVQVIAQLDLAVEHGGRQRAPIVLLPRFVPGT